MTGTEHREVVKRAVKVAKRMADWRWGERLGNTFEGNKKIFWKELKRVKKGEQARDEMVKDVNGQILHDGTEVRRRQAEYFEQVLNVADVREVKYQTRRQLAEAKVGRAISLVEVREAVNELKSGKAPGLDGFPVECLQKGGVAVLGWLARLLNTVLIWGLYL